MEKYIAHVASSTAPTKYISRNCLAENELFTIRSLLAGHHKSPKSTIPLSSITFGIIKNKLGKIKNSRLKVIKILFDSGASDTIVSKNVIGSIKTSKKPESAVEYRWRISF